MKKKYILAVVIFVLVAGSFLSYKALSVPQSNHFSLVEGEKISNFQSVVSEVDRPRVLGEIKLIPSYENVDEYQRLLAIAQNYLLLGEGKSAYKVLIEAVELKPEKSTAFNALGNLLASMNANDSARKALEIAVEKEPAIYTNHAALASYLQERFPSEEEAVKDVYTKGLEATGEHLNLLKDNAAWLESIGDNAGAITLWQKVYERGGYDPAVLKKINKLRTQE